MLCLYEYETNPGIWTISHQLVELFGEVVEPLGSETLLETEHHLHHWADLEFTALPNF